MLQTIADDEGLGTVIRVAGIDFNGDDRMMGWLLFVVTKFLYYMHTQ